MKPKAWLLFSYRVENGRPIIIGVGIYSEPSPTCRIGQGYLQHSVGYGATFAHAKETLVRTLEGPNAWIRAMLERRES